MKEILYVGLDVHAESIAAAAEESAPGHDWQPVGGDPQVGQEAEGTGRNPRLLRGRANGLLPLLATHATGSGLRGDRAESDSEQGQ